MRKSRKAKIGIKERLRSAPSEKRTDLIAGLPHKIGFAKPPKASQFEPGKSGNPKGRPKGARGLAVLLQEELDRRVEMMLDGRRRKVPMAKIIARQLITKAAKGDERAAIFLIESERKQTASNSPPAEPNYTDNDRDNFAVVAELIRASETSDNMNDEEHPNDGPGDEDDFAA